MVLRGTGHAIDRSRFSAKLDLPTRNSLRRAPTNKHLILNHDFTLNDNGAGQIRSTQLNCREPRDSAGDPDQLQILTTVCKVTRIRWEI
jgi:hypothetical protein